MAYKPTGRPVGRPKTKDYQTISLKIPQDLLARVQRYAGLHRQSISELIRDGLEWRITEGDPRWQPTSEARDFGNTVFHELALPVHLLDDRIPLEDDLSPSVPSHDNGITVLLQEPATSENLSSELRPLDARTPPGAPAEAPGHNNGIPVFPTDPPFDTSKHFLGELCIHAHRYHGSGQSLRNQHGKECVRCVAERQARAKARKKQARRTA